MTVVSGPELAAPQAPFRGLSPFGDTEPDALRFFGREREMELISANLIAAKLTILYGPSGVGKTSVIHAGVAQRMRALAVENAALWGHPELAVAIVDRWSGDPIEAVVQAVRAAASDALGEPVENDDKPLPELLTEIAERLGGELYLVLDQFEEYFVYHANEEGLGTLADELPELIARADVPVNVLVSLREDALAQLDAFKARLPGLFANSLRLDRLDRRAARAAVVGPLEAFNRLNPGDERMEVEPALVEAILDQVAVGRIGPRSGGRGVARRASHRGRVEAPYLQLVLQRVWDAERAAGSTRLHVATLEELGGAQRIVESHLERALEELTPGQRDAAANVIDHLVTPSGTKIAHTLRDLASYAHVDLEELQPVAGSLARERILRPLGGDGSSGSERYEIYHDVLADAALAWRARHERERAIALERAASRTRQRRLLAIAGAALVALAAMTVAAAYAFSQRSQANEQERSARARALSETALVRLDVDPQASLGLALRAAELEPTLQTEVVLRRVLGEARLRGVVPLGSDVTHVAYAPDRSELLFGTEADGAVVWSPRERRVVERLRRGDDPVVAAAYSPTGELILTAQGRRALLWDRASGSLLRTIEHSAPVRDASFGAGGARVVTASADGAVRTSRTSDGRTLAVVRPGTKATRALLSPDGRVLVAVAEDAAEHVQSQWYRGGRHAVLDRRGVGDVELSPDGRLLATSNRDGATHLWNARTGAHVRTLDDEGGAVVDVAFSPDESYLATASSDGGVRVWRVRTGDRFFYFIGHTSPVRTVVFDPTGTFVVSTSIDRTARVWRTSGFGAGKQVALLVGHRGAVLTAAVSPGGRTMATGGADGTARLWDGEIEQVLAPVLRGRPPVDVADVSRGDLVVAGDRGGTASVVDLDRGRVTGVVRGGAAVSGAAFAPGGSLLALGFADGVLRLARPDGTVLASARGLGGEVRSVRFAPAGTTVAAAVGSTARVWRVPTAEPAATLEHGAEVRDVALAGGLAATASADGVVRIWDVRSGRLLHATPDGASGVARVLFSPGGDVLASGGDDGTVRLWTPDGKLLHAMRGHPQRVTDLRFDRNGARLLTAGAGPERNAMVWDVQSGRRLHEFVGHFGTVTAIEFSADGRWIVTAGPVSAGIWRADTGRLLHLLYGHDDLLTFAAFTAHGYTVVTAARDGTVRTYRCAVCVRLGGLVALARRRLAAGG